MKVSPLPEVVSPDARLTQLLSHYGLPDHDVALVEPHKNYKGVWRIKFAYEHNEPLSVDIEQASQLAIDLHDMNQKDRACEIEDAIRIARRYMKM